MNAKQHISGHTHLISLLGSPVAHSGSPAMHNLSFEKLGIDSVYLVFDVKEDGVQAALLAMRTLEGWDGSNVTMPCKRAVIPFLDELEPAAELMGAVNVIDKKNGKLKGYNTDGVGFMANLRKHGVACKGATMTLVGLGGAGSAILTQAALDGVATIYAFARSDSNEAYKRAQELIPRLIEKTGCNIELHNLQNTQDLKACIQASDILTNATSVGMGEGSEESLIPIEYLRPDLAVADVVYFPRETRLIRDAKALGCLAIPGLGMLLQQAAASEKIWYGANMPTEDIEKELF